MHGPRLRPVGKVFPLRLDEAKAVAGGRFHHDPPLHSADTLGTESLETDGLGLPVVGLDVDMDVRRVVDRLKQYGRVTIRRPDDGVLSVRVDAAVIAERCRPEGEGVRKVYRLTVDDDDAEARVVGQETSGSKPSKMI